MIQELAEGAGRLRRRHHLQLVERLLQGPKKYPLSFDKALAPAGSEKPYGKKKVEYDLAVNAVSARLRQFPKKTVKEQWAFVPHFFRKYRVESTGREFRELPEIGAPHLITHLPNQTNLGTPEVGPVTLGQPEEIQSFMGITPQLARKLVEKAGKDGRFDFTVMHFMPTAVDHPPGRDAPALARLAIGRPLDAGASKVVPMHVANAFHEQRLLKLVVDHLPHEMRRAYEAKSPSLEIAFYRDGPREGEMKTVALVISKLPPFKTARRRGNARAPAGDAGGAGADGGGDAGVGGAGGDVGNPADGGAGHNPHAPPTLPAGGGDAARRPPIPVSADAEECPSCKNPLKLKPKVKGKVKPGGAKLPPIEAPIVNCPHCKTQLKVEVGMDFKAVKPRRKGA